MEKDSSCFQKKFYEKPESFTGSPSRSPIQIVQKLIRSYLEIQILLRFLRTF